MCRLLIFSLAMVSLVASVGFQPPNIPISAAAKQLLTARTEIERDYRKEYAEICRKYPVKIERAVWAALEAEKNGKNSSKMSSAALELKEKVKQLRNAHDYKIQMLYNQADPMVVKQLKEYDIAVEKASK